MKISRRQLRQIIKEQLIRERMGTDVYKIVVQTLDKQGPKTHQQLLATILDDFPNTSDDELDEYIDGFEESGDIIFDPATQTYH
jgi:bacterioferritin (cytochrome b1)